MQHDSQDVKQSKHWSLTGYCFFKQQVGHNLGMHLPTNPRRLDLDQSEEDNKWTL